MKKNTLTLVNYQFKKLSCEWIDGKQKKPLEINISFNYNIFVNAQAPLLFRQDLFVSITPKKSFQGLSIDTCIVGFFKFEEETPEEDMQNLVRINGTSLLYSTLRGHISTLTANFPNGCQMLPSVIIRDIVADIEKRKKESQTQ